MRIIFAGTPEFSARALKAIVSAGFEVCLVLTQPDRPKGRGLKLQASEVKVLAESLSLPVYQPESLKTQEAQQFLREQEADLMIVAAYGLLLPQNVLDIPRLGCLNIHASLLPRWRGAAPIQRAIEAGDKETGISIMQMNAGLDTGDVLRFYKLPIEAKDTAGSLYERLTDLGAYAVVETLRELPELVPIPQAEEGATYAQKLSKEEAKIFWQESAPVIERKIRAFNPVPCAWTLWQGQPLKIWRAKAISGEGEPGQVVALGPDEILIGTGHGLLSVTELQAAGAKRLTANLFIQGGKLVVGTLLGEGV